MSNVIDFKQLPLSPFLGKWARDPLSVSRNKVVKRRLGPDGLKKLWACGSMEERAQCLAAEPELAERYQVLLGLGRKSFLEVTHQALVWNHSEGGNRPAETRVHPVMRVAVEGRKVVVHTIDVRPARYGRPVAYVLRMNKGWLLVSEQYQGREALYFPRSPVFRYYASK